MPTSVRLTWSEVRPSVHHAQHVLTAGVAGGPRWTLAQVYAPKGELRIAWKVETLQLAEGTLGLSPVNVEPKTYSEAMGTAETYVLNRLGLLGFEFTGQAPRPSRTATLEN